MVELNFSLSAKLRNKSRCKAALLVFSRMDTISIEFILDLTCVSALT